MNYRLLGNSGLRVSEVALGTITFGADWGEPCGTTLGIINHRKFAERNKER
jgi:aryl-alcohol dehydrogenase-like predicted oxidoreductase